MIPAGHHASSALTRRPRSIGRTSRPIIRMAINEHRNDFPPATAAIRADGESSSSPSTIRTGHFTAILPACYCFFGEIPIVASPFRCASRIS